MAKGSTFLIVRRVLRVNALAPRPDWALGLPGLGA